MMHRHASLLRVTSMRALAAVVAATLAAAGTARAQCPSTGDCRKPHGGTGCEMPECCALVCKANPLCCELAWDQACADAAIELCEGINCPADGECLAPHASPGCSDFTCCELVTSIDAWCTFASWDELCADLAARVCGVTPCTLSATDGDDEAEPCYERLNDGCGIGVVSGRIAVTCGATAVFRGRVTTGGPRDLDWFALDGPQRRRLRIAIEAEFPLELQYFRGGCEGPNDVKWLVAPGLCTGPVVVNCIADAGVSSLILGAGTAGLALRNGLDCDEIDPDNPPQPDDPPPEQLFGVRWRARFECLPLGDIDGNGTVGPQDVAALLNAWGPVEQGVAFKPFAADCDLDGDGQVGATDIAALLSSWS
jgi:hypothetical protein